MASPAMKKRYWPLRVNYGPNVVGHTTIDPEFDDMLPPPRFEKPKETRDEQDAELWLQP